MVGDPHGNAAGGANPFSWSQYDKLPPVVRRAIQIAPVQLGTARATYAILEGTAAALVARLELQIAERARRRLLRQYWPAGHPELPE
jgi:hypothetical protein